MPAATELAKHFTTVSAESLPEAPLSEMRRLLLDYLGVALSGSRTESGRIAGEVMIGLGGVPQATVLGRGDKVPAVHAAFANAVSEHSIEMDDVDDLALFHHGPPVVSAALATAEWTNSSGHELLAAMLCGCEMMNRLSLATNPALRDRGYHTTPACGVFGATVAASRLLRLDADQLVSALGLAGAQASGLMEMYGPSMQKRINPGPAARNGVVAAMLAQAGFTGADTVFEGERGFGQAFAGGIDVDVLLEDLGAEVPVAVEYKAYSAARPIHNAIDGALQLKQLGVTASEIERLVVFRHPDWSEYHRNFAPATYHEAQVSLPYSTAVALIDGAALPAQYSDDQVRRPDLVALMGKMRVETDPSLSRGVSCRLEVTRTDGNTVTVQVDDAKGSLGNPMTDADLEAKFTRLVAPVLPKGAPEEIVRAVREVSPVDELIALCAAGEARDGA
ncbi:MmgE/PrpD family protein [Saccharopolyspora sp. TS4A08]|uniref:MmgE/PrpD family protein n=1 Tax=Saccharopolyspora ipomoeae TaxID=3042027 RepID=A0ABT6PRB7_9PSEU|nr:MmgE/PrpD family protein [Saccharopolyspora sp. TS4A08]MDI2030556.1 MmgE/PrpD family protein [Saccharopolyspora sp. TS4A08]